MTISKMTIITKTIIGSKGLADKMEKPLVVDAPKESAGNSKNDPEIGTCPQRDMTGHYLILRRPKLGPNSVTLYCLLFTALLGMSIGVLGGICIYKRYARDQMHRFRTGWYNIPYERIDNNKLPFTSDLSEGIRVDPDLFRDFIKNAEQEVSAIDDSVQNSLQNLFDEAKKHFFKECFEIGLENEHYEEIHVPDFHGGRQGRFIHDFNMNLTGIIDIDGKSCFVMPLNRKVILPPIDLYDLVNKMRKGDYKIDTKTIRETMEAKRPAIYDRSVVGKHIERECKNMPIYELQNVNQTSIVKRSIGNSILFGHYPGKENILEYEIVHFNDDNDMIN